MVARLPSPIDPLPRPPYFAIAPSIQLRVGIRVLQDEAATHDYKVHIINILGGSRLSRSRLGVGIGSRATGVLIASLLRFLSISYKCLEARAVFIANDFVVALAIKIC